MCCSAWIDFTLLIDLSPVGEDGSFTCFILLAYVKERRWEESIYKTS